jgi:hypothetical protein
MTTEQGDLALLDDPVAQELLHSTNLARLAYVWRDGTPRVGPIWFHWDGEEVVLGSPPNAPKVGVLPDNSKVALTIDRDEFPYHALLVRAPPTSRRLRGSPPSTRLAPSDTSVRSRGANGCRAYARCPRT